MDAIDLIEDDEKFERNNEEDNHTAWGGMMFPSERIFGKR